MKGTALHKRTVPATLSRLESIEVRRIRLNLNKAELSQAAGLHGTYGRSLMRGSVISSAGLDKIERALDRLEAEAETKEAA